MEHTTREAAENDIADIVALFNETYALHFQSAPEIFASTPNAVEMREIVLGIFANPDAALLVCETGNTIVGASHIIKEKLPPGSGLRHLAYAKIADLVVTKSMRSRGIGEALVVASEQWAINQGLEVMQLMVWDFNKRAKDFYKRVGFCTASEILWKKLPRKIQGPH